MAGFDTLDDLISELVLGKHWLEVYLKNTPNAVGVADRWRSTWTWAGNPQAGAHSGTALTAAQCLDSTNGAIYHGGDVSPDEKRLLKWGFQAGAAVSTVQPMTAILYDRLLYYPGINAASTSVQTLINSVSLPRYTSGKGVRGFLEVTTAFGVNTGEVALAFTNTNGDSHTVTVNTVASTSATHIPHSGAVAGLWGASGSFYNPFLPVRIDEGDQGMINFTSVQFTTAHASGACALVLGYPLALITIPDTNVLVEREFIYGFPAQPRIYDGACLGILFVPTGAAGALVPYFGDLEFAWG